MFQEEKVFVPCDDEVSAGRFSAFEHTVVGFVNQEMEMRLGFYDDCNLGYRLQERSDLILLPAKFLPQLLRRLCKDGHG